MAQVDRTLEVVKTQVIRAMPARVLQAFFDPPDLAAWWQVVRSIAVPRPLGAYAVEWAPTEFTDDLLGRLGGTLHGTVMDYEPKRTLFIADAYWQPPEGDPIGPMALEIQCRPHGDIFHTLLTVRMSGEDDGPRWQRYFEIMTAGWERALADLQRHLEKEK
jgi:uncharacterized protein YndB with AHSA1/START domain